MTRATLISHDDPLLFLLEAWTEMTQNRLARALVLLHGQLHRSDLRAILAGTPFY